VAGKMKDCDAVYYPDTSPDSLQWGPLRLCRGA